MGRPFAIYASVLGLACASSLSTPDADRLGVQRDPLGISPAGNVPLAHDLAFALSVFGEALPTADRSNVSPRVGQPWL